MPETRILIVEDDPSIRKLIQIGLGKKGFQTECAADGVEGLEAARKHNPDLVILDVTMPKLDGFSVLKELRASEKFAFTPVILLTALGSQDDRVDGFRFGADDYIQKPFRLEELELRVNRVIRNRAQLIYFASGLSRANAQAYRPGMRGTLDIFPALMLLRMLHSEKKSGNLRLQTQQATRTALVTLQEGLLVSMEIEGNTVDHKQGVELIATWVEGEFDFVPEAHPTEVIDVATGDLLYSVHPPPPSKPPPT